MHRIRATSIYSSGGSVLGSRTVRHGSFDIFSRISNDTCLLVRNRFSGIFHCKYEGNLNDTLFDNFSAWKSLQKEDSLIIHRSKALVVVHVLHTMLWLKINMICTTVQAFLLLVILKAFLVLRPKEPWEPVPVLLFSPDFTHGSRFAKFENRSATNLQYETVRRGPLLSPIPIYRGSIRAIDGRRATASERVRHLFTSLRNGVGLSVGSGARYIIRDQCQPAIPLYHHGH